MNKNRIATVLIIYTILFKSTACIAQIDSVHHDNVVPEDSVTSIQADTKQNRKSDIPTYSNPYKFKPIQLIVPVTLISVGIIGLESDWLKYQNREIREELQENINRKFTIDDFTQYAPMVATYGLNVCGIKGLKFRTPVSISLIRIKCKENQDIQKSLKVIFSIVSYLCVSWLISIPQKESNTVCLIRTSSPSLYKKEQVLTIL